MLLLDESQACVSYSHYLVVATCKLACAIEVDEDASTRILLFVYHIHCYVSK